MKHFQIITLLSCITLIAACSTQPIGTDTNASSFSSSTEILSSSEATVMSSDMSSVTSSAIGVTKYTKSSAGYSFVYPATWTLTENVTELFTQSDTGTTVKAPNIASLNDIWLHVAIESACPTIASQTVSKEMIGTDQYTKYDWSDAAMGGERSLGFVYVRSINPKQCVVIQTGVHYHESGFAIDNPNPADQKQQVTDIANAQAQLQTIVHTLTFQK